MTAVVIVVGTSASTAGSDCTTGSITDACGAWPFCREDEPPPPLLPPPPPPPPPRSPLSPPLRSLPLGSAHDWPGASALASSATAGVFGLRPGRPRGVGVPLPPPPSLASLSSTAGGCLAALPSGWRGRALQRCCGCSFSASMSFAFRCRCFEPGTPIIRATSTFERMIAVGRRIRLWSSAPWPAGLLGVGWYRRGSGPSSSLRRRCIRSEARVASCCESCHLRAEGAASVFSTVGAVKSSMAPFGSSG